MTTDRDIYTETVTTLESFLKDTRARFSDGISLSDFGRTVFDGLRICIATVDALPMPGVERKEVVMAWAGDLFEAVSPLLVPTIAWPAWVLFRGTAKSVFLLVVSGAVESLLPIIRGEQ